MAVGKSYIDWHRFHELHRVLVIEYGWIVCIRLVSVNITRGIPTLKKVYANN